MSKFAKAMLIIAGICAVAGMILVTIGVCTGGWKNCLLWAANGDFSIGSSDAHIIHMDGITVNNNYEVYTGDGSEENIASLTEVKNLEFDIIGAELVIEYSNDDQYNIEYSNVRKFQYYVKNETLYVSQCEAYFSGSGSAKIVLYIPEEASYEDVVLSMGGGKATAVGMAAQNASIELGAGSIEMNEFVVKNFNLEIGAGSADFSNCTIGYSNIEIGMGKFTFSGKVLDNVNLECAMGAAEFVIDGEEDDYNYDIQDCTGKIVIGGSSHSGFATEQKINNGSNRNFVIECSLGSVSISFR